MINSVVDRKDIMRTVELTRLHQMAHTIASGKMPMQKMPVDTKRPFLIQGIPLAEEWRAFIYRPGFGMVLFYEAPKGPIYPIHLATIDGPTLAAIVAALGIRLPVGWSQTRLQDVAVRQRQIVVTNLNTLSPEVHPEKLNLPENLFTHSA